MCGDSMHLLESVYVDFSDFTHPITTAGERRFSTNAVEIGLVWSGVSGAASA